MTWSMLLGGEGQWLGCAGTSWVQCTTTKSLLTVRSICVVMAYLEPANARAVSRIRCNGYLPLQGKLAFAQFCYLCVLVANAGNGNYSLKLLSLGTWSRSDYQRAEMANIYH